MDATRNRPRAGRRRIVGSISDLSPLAAGGVGCCTLGTGLSRPRIQGDLSDLRSFAFPFQVGEEIIQNRLHTIGP
jgi:hypothetical protein